MEVETLGWEKWIQGDDVTILQITADSTVGGDLFLSFKFPLCLFFWFLFLPDSTREQLAPHETEDSPYCP